jgi:BirA family biotin operon repressor/biotin-[acetyl-CoA-carboxylase] ligase
MALEDSDSSLLIGRQHIRLKRINSTNKYALDVISKSKPIEGTVISASFQYDGRGQIGRFWESEEDKNITCSIVLKPSFLPAPDQFQLNIAVSLAVLDFVNHFLAKTEVKVSIKWPNDIYVGNEKIGGILIQNTLLGKFISASIIGIGINVNQVKFSSDIPNPTSLIKMLNDKTDLDTAFSYLFRFMTKRYHQLSSGDIESMKEEYLAHLYGKDVWLIFHSENESQFKGKIVDIDEIGRLNIQKKDGIIQSFAFREISLVL